MLCIFFASCYDSQRVCNGIFLQSLIMKYESDELVDFKPCNFSLLKYDVDVFCFFFWMLPHPIKEAMSFITFAVVDPDYPSFAVGGGASEDIVFIGCLRFDCIRYFFQSREVTLGQDV